MLVHGQLRLYPCGETFEIYVCADAGMQHVAACIFLCFMQFMIAGGVFVHQACVGLQGHCWTDRLIQEPTQRGVKTVAEPVFLFVGSIDTVAGICVDAPFTAPYGVYGVHHKVGATAAGLEILIDIAALVGNACPAGGQFDTASGLEYMMPFFAEVPVVVNEGVVGHQGDVAETGNGSDTFAFFSSEILKRHESEELQPFSGIPSSPQLRGMVKLPGLVVRSVAQFHGVGGFKLPVSVPEPNEILMILWQDSQLVAAGRTSADVAGDGGYRHEKGHDEK